MSDHSLWIDQTEYLALAQNLRLHGVFSYGAPHPWGAWGVLYGSGPFVPTAARPPLYPMFIAALWWGHDPPLALVRLVQAVLGAFIPAFVYRMAAKSFGHRVAIVSAFAMVLAPLSTFLTADILSDTLFCFLLCCGLWLWDEGWAWSSGLLFGAAALARDIVLPVVVFLGLLALVLKFNRATHAKIALAALIVMAPWTARNVVTQGAFTPVATTGWGANMLMGTFDVPFGAGNPYMFYQRDPAYSEIVAKSPTEAEADKRMLAEAFKRIGADPLRWILTRVKQLPRLFFEGPTYLYRIVPLPDALTRAAYLLGTALFVILSAVGMAIAIPRWRETYHLAFFPIVLGGLSAVGAPAERYCVPIAPMMVVFDALAASHLADFVRRYARG